MSSCFEYVPEEYAYSHMMYKYTFNAISETINDFEVYIEYYIKDIDKFMEGWPELEKNISRVMTLWFLADWGSEDLLDIILDIIQSSVVLINKLSQDLYNVSSMS